MKIESIKSFVKNEISRITGKRKSLTKENIKSFAKKHKYFLIFFSILFTYYLIWLYAFYPAVMSPDSVYQWFMAKTMLYDNGHPYVYTLMMSITRMIWDNPAAFALVQILITTTITSYLFSFFIKEGVKKRFVIPLFIIFIVFFPSIAIYNITIWKDVVYSQMILLIGTIFIVASYRHKKLSSRNLILFLGFILGTLGLIRVNGLIYLGLVPIFFLIFRSISFKNFIFLQVVGLVVYFIFGVLLYNFFSVTDVYHELLTRASRVQMIGGIVKSGATIYPEEKEVLEIFMPLSEYVQRYKCNAIDYLIYYPSSFKLILFDNPVIAKKFDETSLQIIQRNLPQMLADRTCTFGHLVGLGDVQPSYFFDYGIAPNFEGIKARHDSRLHTFILNIMIWSKNFPQRIFFWVHLVYIVMFAIFMLLAIYKHNKILLGFSLLVIINVPIMFFLAPARDYRYLYMLPLTVVFLPLIYLLVNKNKIL